MSGAWVDGAPMQRSIRVSRGFAINAAAFFFGTILLLVAYETVDLIAVGFIVYASLAVLLLFTPLGGRAEWTMFNRMFAIGWFMSGVAAIYANLFDDAFQISSDAGYFFEIATSGTESVGYLQEVGEGAGAVVIWQAIYNLFAALGFDKLRFVGITANVAIVAVAGVLAIKGTRTVFDADDVRFSRVTAMFAGCGLIWLFAALHLRDSAVFLCITFLVLVWLKYLRKSSAINLALVVIASLLGAPLLALLRTEFVFVPAALLAAALAAIIFFDESRGVRKVIAYTLAILGLTVSAVVFVLLRDDLFSSLGGGYADYMDGLESDGQADQSLGMLFIVGAPIPVRLLLGSAYLFVFPIPFWSGFQLESAYHLFKSFNVLFFYLLTPLFLLALRRILREPAHRSPAIMFLVFVVLGFIIAIAGTSLESRHFGAFFAPLFILALVPDLSRLRDRAAYRRYATLFIGAISLVHVAWAALKFG